MPTLEGEILRKWRTAFGITQVELADACPKPLAKQRIYDIEIREHHLAIDTLVNVIRGLEATAKIRLGRTDADRLAAFLRIDPLTNPGS